MSGADLFEELLEAADRDHCPGASPVLSISEQDEAGYLERIEQAFASRVELYRRGAYHGQWVELDPARLSSARYQAELDSTACARRWQEASPIVLPGVLDEPERSPYSQRLSQAIEDHAELTEAGGLRRWLARARRELDSSFRLSPREAARDDPERDIERCVFVSPSPTGRGRDIDDLWIKTGWLSTYEEDRSLRMRVSFGSEGRDDASRDMLRHRLVAELAGELLPEETAITHSAVADIAGALCSEPVLFTQHIAYWNAPEGGALFHHDAFDESPVGSQLGVAYMQLVGSTAWIALSIANLATRVSEFVEDLEAGDCPWVRAQLYPLPGEWERVLERCRDRATLLRELALPGCGELSSLVNRGPEFTSCLADAGHATVLHPGDAILLPNHGFRRTAMHSVFCASDELTYALSLAIRSKRPPPEWQGAPHPPRAGKRGAPRR